MTRLLLIGLLVGVAGPAAAQRPAPDTLGLLTLNLWHNRGDWEARLPLIVDGIRALDPDVVVLQEVLQNDTLPNQARTIADRLGYGYVHFVSVDSVGAAKRYGNAILARVPFDTAATRALEPRTDYRTAGMVRLALGGRALRVYATHLHHETTPRGSGIRAMQLVDLLDFMAATDDGSPLLLAGDFNATRDGPEFRLLAPLRDLYAHFNPDAPDAPTYGHQGGTPRHIDFVFDGRDPRLVPLSTRIVLDRQAAPGLWPSDHFGIFTRFLLP